MQFAFATPSKTIFKSGALNEMGTQLRGLGNKFLVITDRIFAEMDVLERVEKQLQEQDIGHVYFFDVVGEPELYHVDQAQDLALAEDCDAVLALGGGSILDVGKAVAALITNGGRVRDYMEYVGTGARVEKEPAPFVAAPTTAGTGSEATKAAVIGSHQEKFKRSMRGEQMLPNLVLIDPALMLNLPRRITAISGMDAMSHCMESYVTVRNASPLSRSIAFQGIGLAGAYLKRACYTPGDLEAREGMAAAALCGGMAFDNSGLGAAHGLGMAINIHYSLPHGQSVAIMLPYVMALNTQVYPGLYDQVGEVLTGRRYEQKGDGSKAAVEFIQDLNATIGIPADLRDLDISEEMAEQMGSQVFGTSMSGNPVQLEASHWASLFHQLR